MPWEIVAADIFEFDRSFYIVLVDDFSGFVEVAFLKDISTTTVVNEIKKCFARFGIPQTLITDNGRQFISDEFKKFTKDWGVKHVTSSPYHPQSNGLAERAVQTVKKLFKKCLHDHNDVYMALLKFRTTARDRDLASPAERIFSRKLKTNLPTSTEMLKPKLQKDVKKHLFSKRGKAASYANRGRKPLPEIADGEPVWVRMKDKWIPGRVANRAKENPRSYWVKVNGKSYRKNRYHLRERDIDLPDPIDDTDVAEGSPTEPEKVPEQWRTQKRSSIPRASPHFGNDQRPAKEQTSRYGRPI